MIPRPQSDEEESLGFSVIASSKHNFVGESDMQITIPIFNPAWSQYSEDADRTILLAVILPDQNEIPKFLQNPQFKNGNVLVLNQCPNKNGGQLCHKNITYSYPSVLKKCKYCLVYVPSNVLSYMAIGDILWASCVPLIVNDQYTLPFGQVLDWNKISIQLYEHQVGGALQLLSSISSQQYLQYQRQGQFIWNKYFSTMDNIAMSTLSILESKIFPLRTKSNSFWNGLQTLQRSPLSPSVLQYAPDLGCTVVLLAYDRFKSLFDSIIRLEKLDIVKKIVVVWNNVNVKPPNINAWPKTKIEITVIKAKRNSLHNRFIAFDFLETEAILSFDDDIAMFLDDDEINFAYQVWRQLPAHLVGFISRVHSWDPINNRYSYDSQWTNNVSMVLTGAAFYHKYYGYLYTSELPQSIYDYVDDKMNCEDIAMNFLIANKTGLPPLKVTPKKKLRCPECAPLAADVQHLALRSDCVHKFSEIYGYMPLNTVQFRLDPINYKQKGDDLKFGEL